MTLARLIRISGQRLRSLSDKDHLDAELNRELAFHFEQLVRENVAAGMPPAAARRAARLALGNLSLLEEQCRDQRRVGWLHDLWQDLSYGLRMLRQSPGFTSIVVLSLALGIGVNSAILGAIRATLLARIPFPGGDRLVVVRTYPEWNPALSNSASIPDYIAWKQQSRSFESMGASIADHSRDFGAEEDGRPAERIEGHGFAPSLFAVLGVPPMLGRTFTEAEAEIDHPAAVMVLSHRLWQRRFGGDPGVLGKQVRLSGADLTIIGVMPPDFHYPLEETEYWVPLGINHFQLQGSARFFEVVARLKPGVSLQQAQAEMDGIGAQLARDFPDRHKGWRVRVQTLRDVWYGWMKRPLATLEGAVALVLLIACANIAGLLLARGAARRPEIIMRMALGAGRGRVVRQMLTESVLLSLIGGALGTFVAWGALRALLQMNPPLASQRIAEVAVDLPLLGLLGVLSVATGLIFGIGPAIACFQLDLAGLLKESTRSAGSPFRRNRLQSALVTLQIASALVLLIGSGLLINSFVRLAGFDLNFDPSDLLTFEYRIPQQQYVRNMGVFQGAPYSAIDPSPTPAIQRVYEQLRTMWGPQSVAGISLPPVNSLVQNIMSFSIEDRPAAENAADQNSLRAVYFLITPNFFATMKARLVRGRDLNDSDTASAPWVAIINEAMARRFFPGEDPVGKYLTLGVVSGERPREIIGVVRDIPTRRDRTDPLPAIYTSYLQQSPAYRGPFANMFGQMTFVLRTSGDPLSLVPEARRAVADVDPDHAITRIQTMEQYWGGGMRDKRMLATVLGVFAFVATLLAALGIYGVMAYSVAQRTREIGIRMALGASSTKVLAAIGRRAIILISIGMLLGLAGSVALSRMIASQLWGIEPTDPATFTGVSALLVAVALVASFVPARRAIRVDPTEALRME
ncbi:MAG TPA: ABC transporter permease [Bryobacteraceae bacterium]|nr:ABC transporter permease [Bryobacteraceae bacterium]